MRKHHMFVINVLNDSIEYIFIRIYNTFVGICTPINEENMCARNFVLKKKTHCSFPT